MSFVVGVIRPVVVGMVGTCALAYPSNAFILMRMFVGVFVGCVQGRHSDVERCRKGCKAVGARPSDRRDDRCEQDHHHHQPPHAPRCPIRAQGV